METEVTKRTIISLEEWLKNISYHNIEKEVAIAMKELLAPDPKIDAIFSRQIHWQLKG